MRRSGVQWVGVGLVSLLAACGGGSAGHHDAGSGTEDAAIASDAGTACPTDCDDGVFCNGAEACVDGACAPGEPPVCDDGRGCTVDACSEEERTCVFAPADRDGDEHGAMDCGGDDCDDADPLRYPGAPEICDAGGVDEDCDPTTYGYRDTDMDGFPDARCCNGDECGNDCDDMSGSVHPSLVEGCDGRDNDCDGLTDEDVMVAFYRDGDGDGFAADGSDVESVLGCFAPVGFVDVRGDCNDAENGISPSAYDSCDAALIDENCDGTPNNPPMGCACTLGASRTCMAPGRCASGRELCAAGAWGACSVSPMTEVCNGEDDDCNGTIDDGLRVTCYADGDGDGYAAPGAAESTACACPAGTTRRPPMGSSIDCDDTTPSRSPAAAEICDGADQDCDGVADDGVPTTTVYEDRDRDGHYGTAVTACMGTPGTSPTNDDCEDRRGLVFRGQTAFFEQPYCPSGWTACFARSWRCFEYRSTTGSCYTLTPGTPPTPSWDYDCSGTAEPIPDRNARCGSAFSCRVIPGCAGESGYDYDPAVTPACGTALGGSVIPRHWSCGCGASSECVTNYESGYFPCR